MHSTVLISCLGTEHFLGNFPPRSGICYLGTQTSPKSFQTIVNKSICCSCSPPSPREIWERKLSKKSLLATFRVKFSLAEPQKWHKNCDIKGVNSVWDPPVCARACPRAPLTLPSGGNSPFPYGTTAFPVTFAPDHSTPLQGLKMLQTNIPGGPAGHLPSLPPPPGPFTAWLPCKAHKFHLICLEIIHIHTKNILQCGYFPL